MKAAVLGPVASQGGTPYVPVPYPDTIMATPGLLAYYRMKESSGTAVVDEVAANNGVYSGSPDLAQTSPVPDGAGVKFNGTNQYAQVPLDLSPYDKASVSFLLWWDDFGASGDHWALTFPRGGIDAYWEPGSLPGTQTSGGGFFCVATPDEDSVVVGFGTPVATNWLDKCTAPSSAAWHHYLLTFDRANHANKVFIDGVMKSLTVVGHSGGSYGNFSDDTLDLMALAPLPDSPWTAGDYFSAGRMSELAAFGGVILSATAARRQYEAIAVTP